MPSHHDGISATATRTSVECIGRRVAESAGDEPTAHPTSAGVWDRRCASDAASLETTVRAAAAISDAASWPPAESLPRYRRSPNFSDVIEHGRPRNVNGNSHVSFSARPRLWASRSSRITNTTEPGTGSRSAGTSTRVAGRLARANPIWSSGHGAKSRRGARHRSSAACSLASGAAPGSPCACRESHPRL